MTDAPKLQPQHGEPGTIAVTAEERKGPKATYVAKLSEEQPNVKWDHQADEATMQKVKDKLAKHHITAVNYGVVGGRDEAEWRQIFEFAKKLGFYGITTEDVGKLDLIEKLVKEYDIRVGIHEHARRSNDAGYKIWDPNYVLSLVKDRDRRIGACADRGEFLQQCCGRVANCVQPDRSRKQALPERLIAVLQKGASPSPGDRYASAHEYAQAVRRASGGPLRWLRQMVG